ncbi:hypothetical protein QJS10_CPA06g02389 [Acorus calamus]|uniref:THO complex subunit 5B n=1 Tax=Acorus calamus TaxID=4465 RepID=A0AAV9ENX0_ACOCL|nr:hypothetical protein QJS10_CPA06g02389 [Acorus calamus]
MEAELELPNAAAAPPPPAADPASPTPYEVLEETRTSIEDIAAKMLFIKKEGRPKSELRDLLTQMSLLFVTLRRVNRLVLLEEDRVKAETERAKAPVDMTTLQLHNLIYEKNHYVKAIKACKDFKSRYPEIELVPEEEFLRDAPEGIKTGVLSEDGGHDLMLKRLNFELHQRKELCKLHEKLELHKKGLLSTIANRKKFLSSLPSHLKSLKKASLPVQQQLGIPHTKKLKQFHAAELLTPPLYVVYTQLLAQKEAFGENIDLEILGSMKEAQAFAQQQANKDMGYSTDNENCRIDDDVPDEEEDGQRRRKRTKKVVVAESRDQAGLYQSHPFRIILHVHDDEDCNEKPAKLVSLRFDYMVKLNVVCVGIEGAHEGHDADMLCNLFPDDTGVELPHQTAKLLSGDSVAFYERKNSRPYKWAQHLAGIDFLPEVSPMLSNDGIASSETPKDAAIISGLSLYRHQNRVQTVVQRIRSRKKAQLALVKHLESLTKLHMPPLAYGKVPWASHTPLCSLQSWLPVGCVSDQASSPAVVAIDQVTGSVDLEMNDVSGMPREEIENAREDGELPSTIQAAPPSKDLKTLPSKSPGHEHSRTLTLISKSMIFSSKGRSQSFGRYDDNSELLLDDESDLDEAMHIKSETEVGATAGHDGTIDNSWKDYAVKEFRLVLTKQSERKETRKLEAKVKISAEYPLRPPLFTLSLLNNERGVGHADSAPNDLSINRMESSEWFNELRAMEAEVNLHILKILPLDCESEILAHQIRCLAMLFDFQFEQASGFSEGQKCSSVIDVGLGKPISGSIFARSLRGRDRRRMISWKDMECTQGYPC